MTLAPPTTSRPMVEARALSKDFGATRAVRELSFRVSRGEVVGFLGPNGAGKSTTMKMLTGYLKASGGDALVGGINVARAPLAAKRMIGYLPESVALYEEMMVLDFLRYVATMRGVARARANARLAAICERCGLGEVLGKNIGQLSKGYRQRVGLAQAMVHDPDLLILDEPTSGLDPNQIVEIRELIRELGREKTVILSTHILPEVQASCGRVLIISDGKLVADDTPDALSGGAQNTVRVELAPGEGRAATPEKIATALRALPGVRAVQKLDGDGAADGDADATATSFRVRAHGDSDPRAEISRCAAREGWLVLGLTRERATLEDTFRRLTTGGAQGGDAADGGARA